MKNCLGHSVFEYLYRDAGNYKSWATLLLVGKVTPTEESRLKDKLDGGEFFIPEQIGVPPLCQNLWRIGTGPTSDDHPWHEYCGLRAATIDEIDALPTWGLAQCLLDRVNGVSAWNIGESRAYKALHTNFTSEHVKLEPQR